MLTLPNLLTILRLVVIPFIAFCLMKEQYELALVLFTLSALTDVIDGALARYLQQTSVLGKILDPLADKMLVGVLFIMLFKLGIIPLHYLFLVVSKDILMIILYIVAYLSAIVIDATPTYIGKINTFVQFLVIIMALLVKNNALFGIQDLLLIALKLLLNASLVINIIAGVQYLNRFIKGL